jgi:hypothetical protein
MRVLGRLVNGHHPSLDEFRDLSWPENVDHCNGVVTNLVKHPVRVRLLAVRNLARFNPRFVPLNNGWIKTGVVS